MTRCLSCNGILRTQETTCFGCGAPTVEKKSNGGKRFAGLISILFFASCALTVASLFFDATPPFTACGAATVVLLFVKRSADQFTAKEA
jgi:hypothetical protein